MAEGDDWISTSPILLSQPIRAREYTPGRQLSKQEARDARRRGGAEPSKPPGLTFSQRPLLTAATTESRSTVEAGPSTVPAQGSPKKRRDADDDEGTRKGSPQKAVARSPAKSSLRTRQYEVVPPPENASRHTHSASSGKGKGREVEAEVRRDNTASPAGKQQVRTASTKKTRDTGTNVAVAARQKSPVLPTEAEQMPSPHEDEDEASDKGGKISAEAPARQSQISNASARPEVQADKQPKRKASSLKARAQRKKELADQPAQENAAKGKRKIQEADPSAELGAETKKIKKGKAAQSQKKTDDSGLDLTEETRLDDPKQKTQKKQVNGITTKEVAVIPENGAMDEISNASGPLNGNSIRTTKKGNKQTRTVSAPELFQTSWTAVLKVLKANGTDNQQRKLARKLQDLVRARQEGKAQKLQELFETKQQRKTARAKLDQLDGKRRVLAKKMKQEETEWLTSRAELGVTLALHEAAIRFQHEKLDADDATTTFRPDDLEGILHTFRKHLLRYSSTS